MNTSSDLIQAGVTGGIGSGKTVVCRIFAELGFPVYNADEEAKKLLVSNEKIKNDIKGLLGADAYINDVPDRKYISDQVFRSPEKLDKLNAIIHPEVRKHYHEWVKQHRGKKMVIKEAAILYESGAAADMDFVISVNAPAALRIERVTRRDHSTAEKIEKIMSRQMTDEVRSARADYVITNDDRTPVMAQVLDILSRISAT